MAVGIELLWHSAQVGEREMPLLAQPACLQGSLIQGMARSARQQENTNTRQGEQQPKQKCKNICVGNVFAQRCPPPKKNPSLLVFLPF